MKPSIYKRERESLRILKVLKNTNRKIICLSSTGKDSLLLEYLARKADLDFETYFNVTTCDVADSNLLAKELKHKFIQPQFKFKGIYEYMNKENIVPSRLNRACCMYFKEEPTMRYFNSNEKLILLMGMRNDESANRSEYTTKWVNDKWGKNRDWLGILAIRKWSDLELWCYTLQNNIPINTKYKKGYSRVGCGIVCPNYNKSTWFLDKYWYSNLYKRFQNILKQDFLKNHKWISVHCSLDEYVQGAWTGGLLHKNPPQYVIQEFADYKGINYSVAEKYFEKFCVNGCKSIRQNPLKIKDANTIAMNLKLFGRNITQFKCKKCIMKELNLTKEQWDKYIEDFKRQGCELF